LVPLLINKDISLTSAFSALTLLVGQQGGIRSVKNWAVGCWHGYLSRRGADLLMPLAITVRCFSKIQIGWVPAQPGNPRQSVCVCVCVWAGDCTAVACKVPVVCCMEVRPGP